MWKWWIALVVVSSACSSSGEKSTGPGPANNDPAGESDLEARAMLTAAEGGELELDDGAKVLVPAGALAQDAEVVLKRHCPEVLATAGFGGCQYEISSESALVARIEAVLPDAADCVLAETDDGWRCLADFAVEGGSATATMSRFSALISREGHEGYEDDTCTDVKFAHCGGELTGEWELVRACGSRKQVTGSYSTRNSDPYASCGPDAVYRAYPYSVRGTLEFTEEIIEGTAFGYNRSGGGEMFEHELVTEACLTSVGESCHEICSSNGTVCSCLIEESSWNSGGGGHWEPIDGEVYLDGFTDPLQYCVNGDSLVIEHPHPDGAYHMIYERR